MKILSLAPGQWYNSSSDNGSNRLSLKQTQTKTYVMIYLYHKNEYMSSYTFGLILCSGVVCLTGEKCNALSHFVT